jgi:hypothetical protein
MAGLTQTISQFNIFDASWEALFVKASNLLKRGATYCSAPGPERRSIWVTFLMHEVVKQVPILGNHALDPGPNVVGTENSVDIRVLVEHFYNTAHRSRHHNNVSVDKKQDISPRVTDTEIARGRRS